MKKLENRQLLIVFTTLIFIALAGWTALGSLIPQGLSYVDYIERYGLKGANGIRALGIDGVYTHPLMWVLGFLLVLFLGYYLVSLLRVGKIKRLGFFARFVLHLGLGLVILASGIVAYTSEEVPLELAIGEKKAFTEGAFSGVSVTLEDFKVDFYDDGTPKQYRAKVALQVGKDNIESDIQVNEPLYFKGYRLYQDNYAWEVFGWIKKENKKQAFRLKLGESLSLEGKKVIMLFVPNYEAGKEEPIKPRPDRPHLLVGYQTDLERQEDFIPLGKSKKIGDVEVFFENYQPYSGLYLKEAKGLGLLKLGYFFLILGMGAGYYSFLRRGKDDRNLSL